ncbi:MAG TPA: hypothetical protein PKY08_03170 [Candidatus Magasanikbacteria bacterium]|nr:hypothetical protein [Candidatus Magasanikbacteria bacterium]HQL34416.1 hypothetical protein [bacterium]HQQ38514.1 hypothetical protein [bacterium]
MADSKTIVADIIQYIKNWGGIFSGWYVGIASDPNQRLFTHHNVNKNSDHWVYSESQNSDTARAIEKYIIETYKTKGDTGGGDNTTKYVYAYKITSSTRE